ncbi:MAG: hypothetical protein ACKOGL_03890, partial [Acidimicrobiaceae bacterium]
MINISNISDVEFFPEAEDAFVSILKPVTPLFYDCLNAAQSLITGAQTTTYGASDEVKGNIFARLCFAGPNETAVSSFFQIGRE